MATTDTPPASHKWGWTDWSEVARQAQEQPRTWIHIPREFSQGIPNHIRRGIYRQFINPDDPTPPKAQMKQRWEVTARTVSKEPHRVEIWLRYIG